jgi:hypothetical protein
MTIANKLYINLTSPVPTSVGGNAVNRYKAFNLTNTVPGTTVASDIYGRFLRQAQAATNAPAPVRAKYRVTAEFIPETKINATSGAPQAGLSQGAAGVLFDFITATAASITTARSINPIDYLNFRLRATIVRLVTLASKAAITMSGSILVQRQHSIEV